MPLAGQSPAQGFITDEALQSEARTASKMPKSVINLIICGISAVPPPLTGIFIDIYPKKLRLAVV